MLLFMGHNYVPSGLFSEEANNIGLQNVIVDIVEKGIKYSESDDSFFTIITPVDISGWTKLTLVKAFTKKEEVFDEEEKKIEEIEIEKKSLQNILFVNYNYNVFLIQDNKRITINSAVMALSQLITKAYLVYQCYVDIQIKPVLSKDHFLNAVLSMPVVNTLTTKLYYPNPKHGKMWKPVKDDMEKANSDKRFCTNKSKEGLNFDGESSTSQSLYMVEDGYGDGIAYGIDNQGRRAFVDSKKIEKATFRSETDNVEDISLMLEDASAQISERFQK